MSLFGFHRSGNKVTYKRPAPWSPANVRKVSPPKGSQDQRHTHVDLSKVAKNHEK